MAKRSARFRYAGWALLALAALAALGLALGWTPDLPKQELEARYGAAPSRYVVLPTGARVHYRDRGGPGAPVLVLLHGSNSSLHTWEPWVRVLATKFRVVTLDLQGHGLTGPVPGDDYSLSGMVTLFDEFRSKLGLTRFALGGNSMGGNVSWRFTLAHPDVVTHLILLDAGGVDFLLPPDRQPKLPIGFRIARMPVINRVAGVVTPRSVVEKSLHGTLADPRQVTPQMVNRYWDLLRYPGNRRATRLRNEAHSDNGAADRLGEIRVPTLILWGEEDKLRGVEAARIFRERIKGAELVTYPGVGHVPMEEIPERSAKDAMTFLLATR